MTPISLIYTDELVPYVRVGQERWTARATRYMASKDALALAIRQAAAAIGHHAPDGGGDWGLDLQACRRTRRRYDLDNVIKAVMDAANGIVWEDDHQVAGISADRLPSGSIGDRLAVEFAPVGGRKAGNDDASR